MARIKIVGLIDGRPTPFDGQYLVEYDPSRFGVAPDGRRLSAHIVTTPDLAEATVYSGVDVAIEVWRQQHGIRREDGKPNRPLTAFTVEIV